MPFCLSGLYFPALPSTILCLAQAALALQNANSLCSKWSLEMWMRDVEQKTRGRRKSTKGGLLSMTPLGTWGWILVGHLGAHTKHTLLIPLKGRVTFWNFGESPRRVVRSGLWKTSWCAQEVSTAKRTWSATTRLWCSEKNKPQFLSPWRRASCDLQLKGFLRWTFV